MFGLHGENRGARILARSRTRDGFDAHWRPDRLLRAAGCGKQPAIAAQGDTVGGASVEGGEGVAHLCGMGGCAFGGKRGQFVYGVHGIPRRTANLNCEDRGAFRFLPLRLTFVGLLISPAGWRGARRWLGATCWQRFQARRCLPSCSWFLLQCREPSHPQGFSRCSSFA